MMFKRSTGFLTHEDLRLYLPVNHPIRSVGLGLDGKEDTAYNDRLRAGLELGDRIVHCVNNYERMFEHIKEIMEDCNDYTKSGKNPTEQQYKCALMAFFKKSAALLADLKRGEAGQK